LLELIKAGGWLMVPILLCSVIAMAIVAERFWTLQRRRITPGDLVVQVWQWAKSGNLNDDRIRALRKSSPLGRIRAAGRVDRDTSRVMMKEGIEEVGRHVVHDLDRYLNTLGTIASITPLLGLLGTVIGMIKVFSSILEHGVGDAGLLAGGISEALITTAAGLTVAIPSFFFYRYFKGRVEEYVVSMEEQAINLIEAIERSNVAQLRSAVPGG